MKRLILLFSIIFLMSCSKAISQNEIRKLEDKEVIKYSIGTIVIYSGKDNTYTYLNLEDLKLLIEELYADHPYLTDKEILVSSSVREIRLKVYKDKSRYE